MSNKDLKNDWNIVTTKQISEIIGVKERRVQQLENENALVKVAHGKFDLSKSMKAYVFYILNKNRPSNDDEIDGARENALWIREKKKKTELEVQIMQGELHRSEDVERIMNDMLGAFRARLLSIPTKLAPQVVGKTDIPVVKDLLKEAVYEAMSELSEYDSHVFFDISKDKMFLEDEEPVAELEIDGSKKT